MKKKLAELRQTNGEVQFVASASVKLSCLSRNNRAFEKCGGCDNDCRGYVNDSLIEFATEQERTDRAIKRHDNTYVNVCSVTVHVD